MMHTRTGFNRFKYTAATLGLAVLLAAGGCDDEPVREIDNRPPDFILQDLEGNEFQLSSTQGKVVVLHFFNPQCRSCQAEAPVVNAVHDAYRTRDVVVLGVAVQAESMQQIRDFVEIYEVPYRVLVDADNRVSLSQPPVGYGIPGFPTTFIIDKDVVLHGPYGQMDEETFDELVESFL